ncbi:MAG: trigger factor, partial [Clostridiales bacterium]|nr:trigger factor [Clostridiales bacterium]
YTGMDKDAFRKQFLPQAERQVKVRLALEQIAKLENIHPTDEEIEEELAKLAKSYDIDAEKVKAFIPKEELVKDIAVQKAIDLVRDSAIISEGTEKAE